MKKILITGATGFVGRNLVPALKADGLDSMRLCLLSRDKAKAEELFGACGVIQHIGLDQSDYKTMVRQFNPDIVLHLASFLTSKDDEESILRLIDANIGFGTQLLDALTGTDVSYFINTGSFAEYRMGKGVKSSASLYAATKTAFRSILDYYSAKLGFTWINVIPYTIYGHGDTQKKVLDYIISALDAREPVKMSGGEQILDFIHVSDVEAFLLLLIKEINKFKDSGVEFHLGTGKGTSIRSLAKVVEEIFGQKANISWGALDYRPLDIMYAVADILPLQKMLDWTPVVTLEEGIVRMKEGHN